MKKRFKLLTFVVCIVLATATFGILGGCNGIVGDLTFTGTTLPSANQGTAFSTVLPVATAPEGHTPTITYSLAAGSTLPAGLNFFPVTRTVSGTPTAAVNNATFNIVASAPNFRSVTATFTITVGPPIVEYIGALTFASTTLEQGFTGYVYNYTLPAAIAPEGHTPDITYALYGGDTPPAGLIFNPATRVLSGTPTAEVEGHTFRVIASAEEFVSATATFTIYIAEGGVIGFFGATVYAGINRALSYQLTASTGSGAAITFNTTDTMPAGLTLNAQGLISGTPTVVDDTSISVTASADGYTSVTAQVTINVVLNRATFGVYHADLRTFVGNSPFYDTQVTNWRGLVRTGVPFYTPFSSVGHYSDNGYFLEPTSGSSGDIIWRIYSSMATAATFRMSLGSQLPNADISMFSNADGTANREGGGHVISVNGSNIPFGRDGYSFSLLRRDVPATATEDGMNAIPIPFNMFTLATINLVQGLNIITFTVGGNDWQDKVDPEIPDANFLSSAWAPSIENIQLISAANVVWFMGYDALDVPQGPRDENLDSWYTYLNLARPASSPRPFASAPNTWTPG